jgi:imidazolonepropionase-like amidohydrolase
MLSSGVNVALGTDSRASNPDLSILSEMRFASTQHSTFSPATLLRMVTANAAKSLGREAEIGTLTPGKFADLAIVSLPQHDAADPHELLLDSAAGVSATVFRGHAVHGEKIFMPS